MSPITTVTFVCTDNFTRSKIAELCLNRYLKENGIHNLNVQSAGINTSRDISHYSRAHFQWLGEEELYQSNEIPRNFIGDMTFGKNDLIVAMSEEQMPYLTEHYGTNQVTLYETLAEKKSQWLDPIPFTTYEEFDQKLGKLVEHIKETIPAVYQNIMK